MFHAVRAKHLYSSRLALFTPAKVSLNLGDAVAVHDGEIGRARLRIIATSPSSVTKLQPQSQFLQLLPLKICSIPKL